MAAQMRGSRKVTEGSPYGDVRRVCQNHGSRRVQLEQEGRVSPTETRKGGSSAEIEVEGPAERAPLRGAPACGCGQQGTFSLYPPPPLQAVARIPRWQTQLEAEAKEGRVGADLEGDPCPTPSG